MTRTFGGRVTRAVAVAAAATVAATMLGASATAAPAPEFGACPADAVTADRGVRCAVITVPMDYTRPEGPRIELTVSRIPATGERRGTLFGNPGGPGADALDFWARTADFLPAAIRAEYDLVVVQPRGLRWATPLECAADPESADSDGSAASAASSSEQLLAVGGHEALAAACDAARPGYLDTITTENTARDMDAVRAALGIERIDFLGMSYGTYLGAVYASLFGDRVNRMVLDSNVNPHWVWTEEFARQQVAGKQRLDDLFTWIAENDADYRLGDTPLQVYRTWVRLVADQGGGWYANLTPPPASVRDLPGGLPAPLAEFARDGYNGTAEQTGKAENLVRTLLSAGMSAQVPLVAATNVATATRGYWPVFARAMAEVNTDPANVTRLLALQRATATDAAGGLVFSAVTCNENAVEPRPELIGAAVATLVSGGDAMDARADLVRSGAGCGGWRPVARPVTITGAGLDTPPLLLQSRFDALTSYEGGPALAEALGGRLVTVEGGDHGTFGRGNPAVDDTVLTYLRTGEVTRTTAEQAPFPVP